MSQGFGRKPSVTRESLRAIQEGSSNQSGNSGSGGFALPAPVRGILLGVGVIALLVSMYVVTMKGFGRALDQHWSASVGYPGVEDAYKRTDSTDKLLEAVHNDCKSRSDFVAATSRRRQQT